MSNNLVDKYGLETGQVTVAGKTWHFRELTFTERKDFTKGAVAKEDPQELFLRLFAAVAINPDHSQRFAADDATLGDYSARVVDAVGKQALKLSGIDPDAPRPKRQLTLPADDEAGEAGEKKDD